METMQQYVVRKLNQADVNITAMCKKLGMNRSKVYRVRNGGETSFNTLQKLNDYFKQMAD